MGLKELLGEELYNKVMEKVGDKHKIAIVSDGNWIPKAKFDDINTEKNSYKSQIDRLNNELNTLKTKAANNVEVTKQIESLQEQIIKKENEIENIRKMNAIELNVLKANPIDIADIMPHINTDIITLENTGRIVGLEEQIKSIKEQKPYLFKDNQPSGTGGSKGAGSKDNKSTEPAGIGKRLAVYKQEQQKTVENVQNAYFKDN